MDIEINSRVEEGLLVNAKVSFRQFILNHGCDNPYKSKSLLVKGVVRNFGHRA